MATPAFEFKDRGLSADPQHRNLLSLEKTPGLQVTKLTPVVGTEIRGLQLSGIDESRKNDLALLISQCGVVVFRDQDFKDIGPERQKDFARYFGPLHIHASGSHAKHHLEILNIYLGLTTPTGGRSAMATSPRPASTRTLPSRTLQEGFRHGIRLTT